MSVESAPEALCETAYSAILKNILDFSYQPGEMLSEQNLAEGLGMSRTPIREALHSLERDGLVRILRGRGVMITEFSARELVEVLECREAIELYALSRHPELDPVVLDKLDAIFAWAMKHKLPDSALGVTSKASEELHRRIVASTGNRLMIDQFDRLRIKLVQLRSQLWTEGPESTQGLNQHREIIAALATQRFEEAHRVLRDHIIRGRDRLLRLAAEPLPAGGARQIAGPSELVGEWLADDSSSSADLSERLMALSAEALITRG